MQTRIIQTRFWQDDYICQLKQDEKLLFLYLLTNDKVNLIGIYELPDKYIMFDLDISMDRLQEIKQKLQKDNKFRFFRGWVKIVNYEKYNNYKGELNESAKKKQRNLVSIDVLKELDTVSIEYRQSIDTLNNKYIINKKGEYEGKTEKPIKKEKIKPKTCKEDITSSEFHQYLSSTPPYMNYSISAEYLLLLAEKIDNWAKSKGKQIKDWKATARNWLLKDIEGDKLSKRGRSKFEEIFNSMSGF